MGTIGSINIYNTATINAADVLNSGTPLYNDPSANHIYYYLSAPIGEHYTVVSSTYRNNHILKYGFYTQDEFTFFIIATLQDPVYRPGVFYAPQGAVGSAYHSAISSDSGYTDSATNLRILYINGALTNITSSDIFNFIPFSSITDFFNAVNNGDWQHAVDPYAGAGDSSTGGGGGTFDSSGDDIPVPSLPTLSASNAGFITLFNPSVSQLNNLASYMWTNAAFDIANFKKIFEDPMDCILGLSIVPIAVTTSGSADVAIGNMLISSIQFPVVSSQYQEFNCGSVTIPNFFGGYLDYEPYTKIQIIVPYCGTFQISADDVVGKTITLVYHIDVLTGSCVAMLLCGSSVLYQFNGSCAVNIPINSINYASTIENATRIAVAIGTTVATAGATAPAIMAGGEGAGAAGATLFNSAMNTAGATAEGALSMKPSIERSGALSSSSGMMSVQTPYIVITRPRLCKPKDQNMFKGYPSFIETTLENLNNKGYTEFDTVILKDLYLTDTEKGELDRILRGGVYL